MPSQHSWLLRAAAATLALSAACSDGGRGGGGDGAKSADLAAEDPKAAMAEAAERTTDAKTVRIAMAATNADDVKVVSGTGSYDFTTQRGRFKLQTTVGGTVDVLFSPTEAFLRIPQKAPTDPNWIRAGDNQQSNQFFDSIRKQADPRATLDAIGTNLPDLEKVGRQKIRNVDTTHLRGRVDLSDAAIERAPEARRAGLRSAQQAFGKDGYPIDVWLDGEGRVRRVLYEINSGAGGAQSSVSVRYDLYDFGKVPAIKLPEASDIGDASSLVSPSTTAGK